MNQNLDKTMKTIIKVIIIIITIIIVSVVTIPLSSLSAQYCHVSLPFILTFASGKWVEK